jgi:single-strand DNA-binding protein
MADVNHVILIGRLTRDAELKYTAGGVACCKFSIAVNKSRKQGESWVKETSFFDIVLWGKQGESVNQYLVKGKQVAVEGELHQNRWEKNGQNFSKVDINANNVQLLGGGANGQESAPSQGSAYQKRAPEPVEQELPLSDDGNPPDFPDDIPF